jgi:adenylate cyclase
VHERSGPNPGAAAFADLSGYTRLTEELGDDAAARASIALADLVREIATGHRGTVVKMLGDGVLLHFAEPRDAVLASLDVVEGVGPRGLPPAHVGVDAGPMIYDEGDYWQDRHIAARIASQASSGQVFVGRLREPGAAGRLPAAEAGRSAEGHASDDAVRAPRDRREPS